MSVCTKVQLSVAGAVAAAIMSVSGAASAAENGIYFSAEIARDSADFSRGEFDDIVDEVDFDVDDTGIDKGGGGFSLAIGYQFTPNIALEASYLDLGNVSYEAHGTIDGGEGSTIEDVTLGLGFKSKGPALSAVGIWPINEMFSVDARLGAYRGKTSGVISVSDSETGIEETVVSDSKTGLLVGAGASWELSENVAVRLGYTRLKDAVAERDVDRFSLGLRITF